ncbi:hypothetical protein J1614_003763 [Plenodomus biglobosus]|nr:hypothetical protein J1614_003763 [Plenodomus biglobosus]
MSQDSHIFPFPTASCLKYYIKNTRTLTHPTLPSPRFQLPKSPRPTRPIFIYHRVKTSQSSAYPTNHDASKLQRASKPD